MDNFWDRLILNNTVRDWTICLSIIIGAILLLRLIQIIVIKRLKAYTERTKTSIDDFMVIMIQSSVMPLLYLLSIYFGLKYIKTTSTVDQVMHVAILIVVTFFVLRAITSFVGFAFKETLKRKEKNEQREKQARGILLIIQTIVWVIGSLFLIDNLGYNITTLVAGLGIGGIAIALAAQAILGDLFSYLVIFFDKPFEIGDFIVVGDKKGTIEYIGIKTTRIRSLSGEQ